MKTTMKKATAPNQAQQLTDKLTRHGFRPLRTTKAATVLKKGRLSFVVRQDGSVFSVAPRTGAETLLMRAAA